MGFLKNDERSHKEFKKTLNEKNESCGDYIKVEKELTIEKIFIK